MSKVIAVVNQKGGVGKTTTTASIGVGLARRGKKVLLIDLDPQGNLTINLGFKNPDEIEHTITDILMGMIHHREIPEDCICKLGELDLIPANIELASIELALMNTLSRETLLAKYIRGIKNNYEYIMIDCHPKLDLLTINALVGTDEVIIPTTPEYLSIKGFNFLFNTIQQVRSELNPKIKIAGILPTMVDSRTNLSKLMLRELSEFKDDGINIYDSVIPRSAKTGEASLVGESIMTYDVRNKVAMAYEEVVNQLLKGSEE